MDTIGITQEIAEALCKEGQASVTRGTTAKEFLANCATLGKCACAHFATAVKPILDKHAANAVVTREDIASLGQLANQLHDPTIYLALFDDRSNVVVGSNHKAILYFGSPLDEHQTAADALRSLRKPKEDTAEFEVRDEPRCPECGYTQADASLHGDHHLCRGKIPEPDSPADECECCQAEPPTFRVQIGISPSDLKELGITLSHASAQLAGVVDTHCSEVPKP